jgi:hypothetical protein
MASKLQTLTSGRVPPPGGFPYVEKYVAFIDMLGFRNLVESADASAEKREALANVIGIFRTTIGAHETLGTRVTQFSDSLIVSSDRSESGLHALLSGCTWLAINLLQHAILLRGGISIGGITHEPDVLFGMGINRAYAFDKSGVPPRIALDLEVTLDIQGSATLANWGFVTQDHISGESMLHIFREIEGFDAKPVAGGIRWERHAAEIAEIIRLHSSPDQPEEIRQKYVWLAEYWNKVVAVRNILPRV